MVKTVNILTTWSVKDNTVPSPVRGRCNDYSARKYTQVGGSAIQPKIKNTLTLLVEEIVYSHKKLWAGVEWTNLKGLRRTEENAKGIMPIGKRSLNTKSNMLNLIDLKEPSIIKNIGMKMLTVLMGSIGNHTLIIKSGMMEEDQNFLKNILKLIELERWSIYTSRRVRLFAKKTVNDVARSALLKHITQTMQNLLMLFSYVGFVILKYTGKRNNESFPNITHEFNRLTTLPAAGGAMGEGAITPERRSTFERSNVTMKVIRRKGSVTNFLQDSSGKFIDAAAAEMENHLLAHAFDLSTSMIWGNAGANPYDYSGLDYFISTNRAAYAQARGGSVPTSLKFLDDMIDANTERQGAMHDKAFIMSPQMLSKVSQLLTNVRLVQGLGGGGLSQVDINGGWRMNAYRDIPIIVSSSVRPRGGQVIGLGHTTATTGGSLSDGTYNFCVAAITYNGEELASDNYAVTLSGSTATQTITLTYTAYTGALYYKIYYGTTATNHTLIKQVGAVTYDSQGTVTGNNTSILFTAVTADATSVPSHMQADVPLVATNGVAPETVILWDLDKYQGLGKYAYTNTAGSRFSGLVTMEPLARTDDAQPFLIKTYGALVPSFEATSVISRGWRTV